MGTLYCATTRSKRRREPEHPDLDRASPQHRVRNDDGEPDICAEQRECPDPARESGLPRKGERVRAEPELVVSDRHRVQPQPGEEPKLNRPQGRVEVDVAAEQVPGVQQERVGLRGLEIAEHGRRLHEPADRAIEVLVLGADRVEMRVRVVDAENGDGGFLRDRRANEERRRHDGAQEQLRSACHSSLHGPSVRCFRFPARRGMVGLGT